MWEWMNSIYEVDLPWMRTGPKKKSIYKVERTRYGVWYRAPFFHLLLLSIERERRWRVNGRLFTYFTLVAVLCAQVERPRHIAAATAVLTFQRAANTNTVPTVLLLRYEVRPTFNNSVIYSSYNLYALCSSCSCESLPFEKRCPSTLSLYFKDESNFSNPLEPWRNWGITIFHLDSDFWLQICFTISSSIEAKLLNQTSFKNHFLWLFFIELSICVFYCRSLLEVINFEMNEFLNLYYIFETWTILRGVLD